MNAVSQATRRAMSRRFNLAFRFHSTNNKNATTGTAKTTPSSWLEWYSSKLDSHPITTKCLTAGMIAGFGDVVCQGIQQNMLADNSKKSNQDDNDQKNSFLFLSHWDAMRTCRFVLLGGALVGPVIHAWYLILSRTAPGTRLSSVLQRVALDQFCFTPAFVPIWLMSLWTLEGRQEWQLSNVQREMERIIPINWCVWIPAGMINFRFVPIKYQVLFQNIVSLFWNAFLSYTQSTPKETNADQQEEAAASGAASA